MGTAFKLDYEIHVVPPTAVAENSVDLEIERFEQALQVTKNELHDIKESLAKKMGDDHAKIFDAHLLILDDVMVTEDTIDVIKKENISAASAFQNVISKVLSTLQGI